MKFLFILVYLFSFLFYFDIFFLDKSIRETWVPGGEKKTCKRNLWQLYNEGTLGTFTCKNFLLENKKKIYFLFF